MKTITTQPLDYIFPCHYQALFQPNKNPKLHLSSCTAHGEEVGRSKKLTLS